MKDEELNSISECWEGVSKGFQKLTFEEAHSDMAALIAEVRALRRENSDLKYRLNNVSLMAANTSQQMLSELERVILKYS